MRGIIADRNIEGPVLRMVEWIQSSDWAEIWNDLGVDVVLFADLGWPDRLSDRDVWLRCQAEGLILITDNRNNENSSSLEATLRTELRPDSLPVLTISSMDKFRHDPDYAARVAVELLDVLYDIRRFNTRLGAGRIFLP